MKETNQDMGWLILFFIASGFSGFIITPQVVESDLSMQIFVGAIIMLFVFTICMICFMLMRKQSKKDMLHHALDRGNYQFVYQQIDADGKAMKELWELKILSAFHSGATLEFHKLYQNYMNEINEANTLDRYIILILDELLCASESTKKPVSFMKKLDQPSYKYRKSIHYQIWRNIRLGLQEFYKPQKNLVKVYFEKFLIQADVVSKPLCFYLYYVMLLAMVQDEHPQLDDYIQKMMSYIFDSASLKQAEQLRNWLLHEQKGTGYQEHMEHNFKGRTPFEGETKKDSENKVFSYQSPFQQTQNNKEQQGFTSRQQTHHYQNDFDELNASLQNEPAFNLYEDDTVKATSNQAGIENVFHSSSVDEDADLDPTWFARRSTEATTNESLPLRQMRSPRMEERDDTSMVNPMQQNPHINANTYQDAPMQEQNDAVFARQRREQPTFVNQRNQTAMSFDGPNPMAQPQNSQDPYAAMRRANTQAQFNNVNDNVEKNQQAAAFNRPRDMQNRMQFQQRSNIQQRQGPQGGQVASEPQTQSPQVDRFAHFQQRTQTPTPPTEPTIQPQVSVQTAESEKTSRFNRKQKANDPFNFDNDRTDKKDRSFATPGIMDPNQETKTSEFHNQHKMKMSNDVSYNSVMETTNPHRLFVKQNLIIFVITLFDAMIVSVASSSFIYTSFFNKYSSITSQIIPEIVMTALILALLITYLTAGIHCGFTILSKTTKKWNRVVKICTFPIMLIIYLIIGAVCEIPYLILNMIKASRTV